VTGAPHGREKNEGRSIMQVPNDNVQPCWSCKNNAATNDYTRAGRTVGLCASCLDRHEIQEASECVKLPAIEALKENGQYDEALAYLDAFLTANRHRDHDGWLARRIAQDRESIYWDAGRYAEALQACDAIEELGFENVWDRWALGSARADALAGLERHEEALAAFEEAFGHQDPRFRSSAMDFLRALVEYSQNAGHPVHEKWRSVAQAAAEEYAVEMPTRESLGESILALHEITRGMSPRRTPDGNQEPT